MTVMDQPIPKFIKGAAVGFSACIYRLPVIAHQTVVIISIAHPAAQSFTQRPSAGQWCNDRLGHRQDTGHRFHIHPAFQEVCLRDEYIGQVCGFVRRTGYCNYICDLPDGAYQAPIFREIGHRIDAGNKQCPYSAGCHAVDQTMQFLSGGTALITGPVQDNCYADVIQ